MTRVPSLKARALRYLSSRDYSRKELARKLLRFVEDGDDLGDLLAWLEAQGFLSDTRFAESLVRRRMGRYGNSRIKQELRNHQVTDALPDDAMQELIDNEAARAYEVWERKFGELATDQKERARQMRFLQQRGFSSEVIRKIMTKGKG
ncbi:recombination regulator RecX [Oxalobacter vibrioformis]|uniref:Regulatory protein RecX n=1 Tax=Oxalobacter vibrioformis TaxID=933080 RepID=A0A9E9P2P3_9BURK|nr:recombination regulator RecX [Oxalobacter vibrioformis]NLC23801.1 recombination regulator RecX [Oxalobacter sp.]WAW09223.1 recombination regulator RecX [Oxalobacter vibrioformis]